MSERDNDISDETLAAYLDGELSRAEADMVADALVESPHLAARLAAMEVPISELKPAFAQMLEDMPADLLPREATNPQPVFPLSGAIAAAIALAVGLGLGASVLRYDSGDAPDWQDYVASYQALYVTETLAVVDQSPELSAEQLETVSAVLGRDMQAARDVPGLFYKRAQVLGFQGTPLVQLAYLAQDGAPMALCVIAKSDDAPLQTMRLEGMEAASWSDGAFSYLLIGGDDARRVATAAAHLQAAL